MSIVTHSGNCYALLVFKVNFCTLGQAYKVHGKENYEIKNPKTGEYQPFLKWFYKVHFGNKIKHTFGALLVKSLYVR